MKPLLYIDVDGVLNAVRLPTDSEKGLEAMGYQICRCPAAGHEEFARLFELYDVYWATTWAENAAKFIAPLFNIPECNILEMPYMPNARGKFASLIAHAQGRPFVWVDDDAKYEQEAKRVCMERSEPCLIISPATNVGLTVPHLEALLQFGADPAGNKFYLIKDEYDHVRGTVSQAFVRVHT